MKLKESPLDLTGRFSPSVTSDSGVSTASSASLRSDDSKREPINFKGRLSPRSDISSLSEEEEDVAADDVAFQFKKEIEGLCLQIDGLAKKAEGVNLDLMRVFQNVGAPAGSIRGEGSPGYINAKRRLSETSDSGVSTVSLRCDDSKREPINFKVQLSPRQKEDLKQACLEIDKAMKQLEEAQLEFMSLGDLL